MITLTIENGVVVELDGKRRADFDMLDTFIATYGMNLERAVEVNAMDSVRLAHMLCDINVPRHELIPLTTAMTPAKAAEVVFGGSERRREQRAGHRQRTDRFHQLERQQFGR